MHHRDSFFWIVIERIFYSLSSCCEPDPGASDKGSAANKMVLSQGQ